MRFTADFGPRWLRAAAFAVNLSLLASVGFLVGAMVVYPGGSFVNPSAPRYDLFRNYFCDLIQPLAHNGFLNPLGATLGQAGMGAMAIALALLWQLVPRLFPTRRKLGAAVRIAGALSALALPGVALTPSMLGPELHTLAIIAAGTPGVTALILSTMGILSDWQRLRRLAGLTAALLFCALLTSALWAYLFFDLWPERWALPTMQKVAWVLLVVWMLAVTRRAQSPMSEPLS